MNNLNVDTTFLNRPIQELPSKFTPKEYRKNIIELEKQFIEKEESYTGDIVDQINPLKHTFADGLYIREIFMPKNELSITKIHKYSHPFILLQGKMSVMSEEGEKIIHAPYYCITPSGTKRIIYTLTDCILMTVHKTKEKELEKIENEIIAQTYEELESK